MCPLRLRLQQITDEYDRSIHAEHIEALRPHFRHSILPILDPTPDRTYNCVMHALDLKADDFQVPAMAAAAARTSLIDFLICHKYLIACSFEFNEPLVVYSAAMEVKHIGRVMKDARIVSKWGSGNLYEHGLWEIPDSYGCNASFFVRLDHSTLVDRISEWQASVKYC